MTMKDKQTKTTTKSNTTMSKTKSNTEMNESQIENVQSEVVASATTVEVKSVAQAVQMYIERHNEAKAEEVIAFLTKAGAVVSPATVRSQVAAARKALGLTKPRIAAPVEAIKAAFEAGNTTLAQVLDSLKASGIDASESTVRSQVTKLRKEAGMGRKTFTVSFE